MNKSLQAFVISFAVLLNFNSYADLSENDPYLTKQKEECSKQLNKSWDSSRNRCVENVQNKEMRKADTAAGNRCLEIKDLEARKKCFIEDARSKTQGMNTSPGGGALKGTDAIVTHAYTVMSLIQMATNGVESNCTSKTIFGATSLVGSLTDIYLKIQTKKKLKSLQDKYQIDTKTGRHDAQVRALEYLKEEQETLADIASKEKKRNMLMMAGYGAALGFALFEYGSNSVCAGGEAKPVGDTAAAPATQNSATPVAPEESLVEVKAISDSNIEMTQITPATPVPEVIPSSTVASAPVTPPTAQMTMFTGTNGKTYVNGTLPNNQAFDIVGNKVFDPKGNPLGSFSQGKIILNSGQSFPTTLTPSTTKFHSWQPPVDRPSGWTLK